MYFWSQGHCGVCAARHRQAWHHSHCVLHPAWGRGKWEWRRSIESDIRKIVKGRTDRFDLSHIQLTENIIRKTKDHYHKTLQRGIQVGILTLSTIKRWNLCEIAFCAKIRRWQALGEVVAGITMTWLICSLYQKNDLFWEVSETVDLK